MARSWTQYRMNLSSYWRERLFSKKCTHLDIFLYEIPVEYSRKYTHLILVEHREGGAKLTKQEAYVFIAYSFVPPIPVKNLSSFLDRVDLTEPIKSNGRSQLDRPKGRALARWFKAYHHAYLRGLVVKIARLIQIVEGKRTSIRFHYFTVSDLDPTHKFSNHWWRIGKGQGRGDPTVIHPYPQDDILGKQLGKWVDSTE